MWRSNLLLALSCYVRRLGTICARAANGLYDLARTLDRMSADLFARYDKEQFEEG